MEFFRGRTVSSSSTSDDGVRVLSSVKAYSRFLTVYDTCVEFAPSSSSSLASPSGGSGSGSGSGLGSSLGLESSASAVQQFSFDVVGHPRNSFKFACVMPVSISDNGQGQPRVTTTVVWEYAQGLNAICVGFPTGGFDASKHDTIVDTARAELAEPQHAPLGRGLQESTTEEPPSTVATRTRNTTPKWPPPVRPMRSAPA